MAEHTPTPWRYRPKEFDDWGVIRGPDDTLAAVAKYGDCPDLDLDKHRHNRTDPAEANAAFIVKAVNEHDAHETVAIVALELVTECAGDLPPSLGVLEKLCDALNALVKAKGSSGAVGSPPHD